MPSAKLLLHAGTHKTGTTAIQQALTANRAWLDGHGVLYPQYLPLGHLTFLAHHALAQSLARRTVKDYLLLLQFQLRLRQSSRPKRLTVLSAESIYRHVVGRPPRTSDEFYVGHRAYLERTKRLLKDFQITVLLYFRRPDLSALSRYKERAVRGTSCGDLGSFVKMRPWLYDYRRRVELFRKILGDVEFRIYETERRSGLVDRFFNQLDLPVPPNLTGSFTRPSPTNRATLWLKRAQEESPRTWQDHQHRVLFAQHPEGKAFFNEHQSSTLWPSGSCFVEFVDRNSDAYELGGFAQPVPPNSQPTEWTDELHHAAQTAFAAWEISNATNLKQRRRMGLRFFEEPLVGGTS